jgi:hypothetical protein
MNEGLQWLARQLAWEDRFDQLHAEHAEHDTPIATVAHLTPPQPIVTVHAPTAAQLVGGDQAA